MIRADSPERPRLWLVRADSSRRIWVHVANCSRREALALARDHAAQGASATCHPVQAGWLQFELPLQVNWGLVIGGAGIAAGLALCAAI